jgi:hypothetical protein
MEDVTRREVMKIAATVGVAAGAVTLGSAGARAQDEKAQQPAAGEREALQTAQEELEAQAPQSPGPEEKGQEYAAEQLRAVRRAWISVFGGFLVANKSRGIFRLPATEIHIATSATVSQVGPWTRLRMQGLPRSFGTVLVDVTREPWGPRRDRNSVVIWWQKPNQPFQSWRDDTATAGFAFGDLG